jgi:hypothetical protein
MEDKGGKIRKEQDERPNFSLWQLDTSLNWIPFLLFLLYIICPLQTLRSLLVDEESTAATGLVTISNLQLTHISTGKRGTNGSSGPSSSLQIRKRAR